MANLVPAWTAPRAVSRTTSQINEPSPLASEVEEARQRTLRINRRLTQGNRKSTIGLELKKLELEQIQSQIDDLTDSMKLADQSKRHSRMIKEKMQRDVSAAPAMPMPSIATEGRRTVMRSIKLSKGWSDESPEWQAMVNKEKEMEAKEEAERLALEKRAAEVEAQLRRRQKLRQQERSKQQQEQLERLKRQLAELESTLEKEAENDEAALLAEFERRKAEAHARMEAQRREREQQRQEDERIRKEREEALVRRKREVEQRSKELEEALWRKEEERLQADQSRLDRLKSMLDDPNAVATTSSTPATLSPAYEAELKRKEEEVRLREARLVEHAAKLEAVAARLQRLPDIDSLLKALEGFKGGDLSALVGLSNNAGGAGRKTAEIYKTEIAELQQVIMDEKKSPKEIDDANIKLEKLMQEYEKTPEYRAEVEKAQQERRARNDKPNTEALQRMKQTYNVANVQQNSEITARIAAHPELRMLFMEPNTILRIYDKDFASYTLRGLELDELRAIAALMPKFGANQKIQQAWVQGLHDKIDAMASKPAETTVKRPPLPSKPAARSAVRRAAAPAGGDIFEEIRRRGGKATASPSAAPHPASPSAPTLPSLTQARPALPPIPKAPGVSTLSSAPTPKLALPPLPPLAIKVPAPPAPAAAEPLVQPVQASLERLVKFLAQSSASNTEKDTAAETRTLVSATKQLADVVAARGKNAVANALRDLASEMVVAVRAVLVSRRAGGAEAATAKAQLVRCIDALRKAMREL